jgi:hypothetical protein
MATDQNTYGSEANSVTDPFAGALTAKLEEFDELTEFLVNPEVGSKIVKSGDRFYFQAPGLTQGLYRWITGESRDTTREYLEELTTKLVAILSEMRTTIENLAVIWKADKPSNFGRTRSGPAQQILNSVAHTDENKRPGLLSLLDIRPTKERIDEISNLLKQADILSARVLTATEHVKHLYHSEMQEVEEGLESEETSTSAADGECVPADSASNVHPDSAPPPLSYEAMIESVRSAHAALCQTCSLLQS